MREVKLALVGFGSAGQAFARMLMDKEQALKEKYNTRVTVVAITTKTRGNLVDAWGLDLDKALKNIEHSGRFEKILGYSEYTSSQEVIDNVDYDVMIELTPLQFSSGKIATNHVRGALSRGKHAITANKGPVAWHHKDLKELAERNNCKFLHETTVMDGTPIFNMKRGCLSMCKIVGFRGILNSTTNYILDELGKGKEKAAIIKEGKRRGFIEQDPETDIDGYDAAAKVAAVANVLMEADISPNEVQRQGIADITKEQIQKAAEKGKTIKLMCRGYVEGDKVIGKVQPEEVDNTDIYATIAGTSSVLTIETDLMGTLTIIEEAPEIQQTAYGIFADLMTIIEMN